jgi:mannose-6-phosphate isomerase-like protein (cupin superfamily)
MASKANPQTGSQAALPADDPQRKLAVTRTESGRHIGVVGDTYTIFSLIEGELELTFRGNKSTVRAGETVNIPANAPHQFRNSSSQPARMFCICAPAGQEDFFLEIGVPVASRTAPPPKLDEAGQAEFRKKAEALAAKYRTELLPHA